MTTLAVFLDTLASRFDGAGLEYGHGTDNAWDEAVALSLGVLNWSDDAANLNREIPPDAQLQIEQLVQRRIAERVPVPLLLGRAWFAGHEFNVAKNVMVPRSPFAELIRQGFSPWLNEAPRQILDLCAGGGSIGIACALHWGDARVVLGEVDAVACELAKANIAKHGLGKRVRVVQSDLFESIDGRFDLIVSNPPYVPTNDSDARGGEFQHEPDRAFDGGPDGMALVSELLVSAPEYLLPDGNLFVEVGQYRAELEQRYPKLPFVWPDLCEGGEGVFLLAARDIPG